MKIRILFTTILALVLIGGVQGCGSASNNDQGVSFTLVGWDISADGNPASGITIPISDPNPESGGAGELILAARVQNNLTDQGIRLTRVYHSYVVAGAQVEIPSDSVAVGGVLGPSPGEGGVSSSLPPGFLNIESESSFEVPVVTAGVRQFLNLNRNQFPEPPFQMTVVSFVEGISTAGDTLDTNSLSFPITVTSDAVISPSPADGSGDPLTEGEESGETDSLQDVETPPTFGSGDGDSSSQDGEDFEDLF